MVREKDYASRATALQLLPPESVKRAQTESARSRSQLRPVPETSADASEPRGRDDDREASQDSLCSLSHPHTLSLSLSFVAQ